MTISYKLNKNLVGRAATMLCWGLTQTQGEVRVINKEERMINAKSLIGLLSAAIKADDEIKIIIDKDKDLDKVKKVFNEVGKEI